MHENKDMVATTPKLKLPKPRLRVGGMTRVRTDWNDNHVYVFSPWVRRLVVERKALLTIQGDLLPLLVSRQFLGISKTFGSRVEDDIVKDVLATSPDLVGSDRAGLMDGTSNLGASSDRMKRQQQLLAADSEYTVLAHVQDEVVRAHTISSYLHASREVLTLACSEPTTEVNSKTKSIQVSQLPPNTSVRGKFHSILLPGSTTGDKVTYKCASVGRNCKLGNKCRLNNVIIMDDVTLGNNVILQNSIIGAKSTIGDNCSLNDCQVAPGTVVSSGEKAKGETFS